MKAALPAEILRAARVPHGLRSGGSPSRAALLGGCLLVGFLFAGGCAGESPEGEPPVLSPADAVGGFVIDETAFDAPAPPGQVPFDLLAADMDLDGDPDLLANWHNRARLELFENVDGRFVLVNGEGADPSGLFDDPGVASVYAPVDAMLERIRARREAGVFVWHEPDRRGDWHVYVIPDDGAVSLEVRANQALTPRLEERFVRRAGEHDAELEFDAEVHFRLGVAFVSTQLALRASSPLFVGPEMQRFDGGEIDLWKDDPHGIAWVDVRGTRHPDLFITRGGLMGTLTPPHDPKNDRLFVYAGRAPASDPTAGAGLAAGGAGPLIYEDHRRSIPADYGRGRRVEWVDIDGDASLELYVGNTASPNALLVALGETYRDIAAEVGLDFSAGDTFAWLDVDDSGLDDLVFVGDDDFGIAYNRGERRFDVVAGATAGLSLPPLAAAEALPDAAATEELFANLSLHVLDVDNDGRLDLWLVGHGDRRRHVLYLRGERGFEEASEAYGLADQPGANSLIPLDVDNDGFVDAIAPGLEWMLLRNDGGQRFVGERLAGPWDLPAYTRGIALDVNGDRKLDIALIGNRRLLARNVAAGGDALMITPTGGAADAVGALVQAFYANGMVRAQRYGSAVSTQYSQGLLPLHFGVPAGNPIDSISVRWPDGTTIDRAAGAGVSMLEIGR